MNFDPRMSLFESAMRPVPKGEITVAELVAMVRNPEPGLRQALARAREALAAGDSEKYSMLKRGLPAASFAGTFSKRANAALTGHSGLMPIDLDHLDASALEAARAQLAADPYCVFLYVSPSGAGLKGALRIDPAPADDAQHKTAFAAVGNYLRAVHGLTLDPACKDVSRLAFLSHDHECHHQAGATALPVSEWACTPATELQPKPETAAEDAGNESSENTGDAEDDSDSEDDMPYQENDSGRAARYCGRWGDEVRYVPERAFWLVWEGRWKKDITGGRYRRAITLANERIREVLATPTTSDEDLEKRTKSLKKAAKWGDLPYIERMLTLAEKRTSIQCPSEQLDADPFLLGTPNAIVNLRTGEAWSHDPAQLVTMSTRAEFDAAAAAPRWEQFMEEIFPDPELRRYQWKAWGYALTGATSEKCFHFLIGSGNNGKSKQCEAIEWVLGDYAGHAPKPLLCANDRGAYPLREAASIVGKRLLIGAETEAKEKLNVSVVKSLTGHGDVMRAANLYENQFDFIPVGKLFVMGNHKPDIGDTGPAIWNRVRLIPYERVFADAQQDRGLGEKFRAEASGILNWLIQGALLWQDEGLQPPARVRAAVNEYRREEDSLSDFLAECTESGTDETITHGSLFRRYVSWTKDEGIRFGMTRKGLAKALRERGWHECRTAESFTNWRGISLC